MKGKISSGGGGASSLIDYLFDRKDQTPVPGIAIGFAAEPDFLGDDEKAENQENEKSETPDEGKEERDLPERSDESEENAQIEEKQTGGYRGVIVGGNMVGENPEELKVEFRLFERLRPDVGRPIWHCSLSLPVGESLSADEWQAVTDDFVERMGFTELTPFVVVRHQDTEHDHVHIVASRISLDGKLWDNGFDVFRMMKVTQELEVDHHLVRTRGYDGPDPSRKSRGRELQREQQGETSPRQRLREMISQALEGNPTVVTFAGRLMVKGVEVGAKFSPEGELFGLSYSLSDMKFRGRDLGKNYSWEGLLGRGIVYDPDSDQQSLRWFDRSQPSDGLLVFPGPKSELWIVRSPEEALAVQKVVGAERAVTILVCPDGKVGSLSEPATVLRLAEASTITITRRRGMDEISSASETAWHEAVVATVSRHSDAALHEWFAPDGYTDIVEFVERGQFVDLPVEPEPELAGVVVVTRKFETALAAIDLIGARDGKTPTVLLLEDDDVSDLLIDPEMKAAVTRAREILWFSPAATNPTRRAAEEAHFLRVADVLGEISNVEIRKREIDLNDFRIESAPKTALSGVTDAAPVAEVICPVILPGDPKVVVVCQSIEDANAIQQMEKTETGSSPTFVVVSHDQSVLSITHEKSRQLLAQAHEIHLADQRKPLDYAQFRKNQARVEELRQTLQNLSLAPFRVVAPKEGFESFEQQYEELLNSEIENGARKPAIHGGDNGLVWVVRGQFEVDALIDHYTEKGFAVPTIIRTAYGDPIGSLDHPAAVAALASAREVLIARRTEDEGIGRGYERYVCAEIAKKLPEKVPAGCPVNDWVPPENFRNLRDVQIQESNRIAAIPEPEVIHGHPSIVILAHKAQVDQAVRPVKIGEGYATPTVIMYDPQRPYDVVDHPGTLKILRQAQEVQLIHLGGVSPQRNSPEDQFQRAMTQELGAVTPAVITNRTLETKPDKTLQTTGQSNSPSGTQPKAAPKPSRDFGIGF